MMGITRQTDYAVRIVLHLASQTEDELVSISEIASTRRLPVPFVRRVVSRLAEVGILKTVRGAAGGVRLNRPSSEISLLDVVSCMEDSICPSPCVEEPEGCPFGRTCPVQGVWTDTTRVLQDHLRGVRFSDLAEAPGHREAHERVAHRATRIFPKRRATST